MFRRIVVGRLVEEIRCFAQYQEGVRESGRDPELAVIAFSELDAYPLAERRGAAADIHCNVEHPAGGDPHQLALRLPDLVVQPPQHPADAATVVVLDESHVGPRGLVELPLIEAFVEEATGIAEHSGFEDEDARKTGGNDLHRGEDGRWIAAPACGLGTAHAAPTAISPAALVARQPAAKDIDRSCS